MKPRKRPGKKRAKSVGEAVVLITAGSGEEGHKIAQALVGEHLVACVNILPHVRSIYFWQGKLCDEPEVLLVCKCRAARFDRLMQRVKELHSYTVPEIIALPIVQGSPEYLRWIREVTPV